MEIGNAVPRKLTQEPIITSVPAIVHVGNKENPKLPVGCPSVVCQIHAHKLVLMLTVSTMLSITVIQRVTSELSSGKPSKRKPRPSLA